MSLSVLKCVRLVTWSIEMIAIFSILMIVVVDAIRLDWSEGKIDILSMKQRSTV